MKTKLTPFVFVISMATICGAQQDPEMSVQSGEQLVDLTVKNTTTGNVVVAWVNFEGQMVDYGTLVPGQSAGLQTYAGHLWKFRSGNQIMGRYRSTAAPKQTFTIGNVAPVQPKVPMTRPVAPQPTQPAQPPAGRGAITKTGSKISVPDAQQLLNYHNQARREVGVADVTWSTEVAAFAQQWADHMARTGRFEHRPNDQQKYGENIATGTTGAYTVMMLAKQWYDEKRIYRPGAPFSMAQMPAAHYTQMVWSGSTMIGAGIAVCQTGQLRGMTVLVCNYSPRGNRIGTRPF